MVKSNCNTATLQRTVPKIAQKREAVSRIAKRRFSHGERPFLS